MRGPLFEAGQQYLLPGVEAVRGSRGSLRGSDVDLETGISKETWRVRGHPSKHQVPLDRLRVLFKLLARDVVHDRPVIHDQDAVRRQ